MAEWHEIQNDFSGGEISPRYFMRGGTEQYSKSAFLLQNFIPTLQGSIVRAPGSRFVYEILEDDETTTPPTARILPYLTPDGIPSIVEIIGINGGQNGRVIWQGSQCV